MNFIPESLHSRITAEATGEAADVIIGQLDPLMVTARDAGAFEFGDKTGNSRTQGLGIEIGEHGRTGPEDGVRAHASAETDPAEIPALTPADAERITDARRLKTGLSGRDRAPATIDPDLPLTAQASHEEGAALVGPDDLIRRQHLSYP